MIPPLKCLLLLGLLVRSVTLGKETGSLRKFRRPCFEDEEVESTCASPEDKCHEHRQSEFKLHRVDGVKTGHVRRVELEANKTYTMITRAMRPLLFELPKFLSNDECDHIIDLAMDSGLKTSIAGLDLDAYDGELEEELSEGDDGELDAEEKWAGEIGKWDRNNDSMIDEKELQFFAKRHFLLFIAQGEFQKLFENIGYKGFKEGNITREAFEQLNVKKFLIYLDFLKEKSPRYRPRFSQQAWLRQNKQSDPVLRTLFERVIKLTQLPRKVVQGGEALQVVRYTEYGHYHGHLDSSPSNSSVICCHQNHFRPGAQCRICRFITILYFLNDVEEGGETAFLLADNDTVSPQDLESPKHPNDEFNLSINCHMADRVITPKKGTAIMWYNHLVDPASGLLGPLDPYSVHGGCDVTKGTKWIANNWITAPSKNSVHIKSLYDVGFE